MNTQWKSGQLVRRSDHQIKESGVKPALGIVVDVKVFTENHNLIHYPVIHWQGQPMESITHPLNATVVSSEEMIAALSSKRYHD